MHFSIPDTQELFSETTGTSYTGYNIYINGSYHACLRYKQLHALNEQLRRMCVPMGVIMPEFPPKKFLPLTNSQVENRRQALEHYLQMMGQDTRVSKLETFQRFFLNSQLETALAEGVFEEYFGYGSEESTASTGVEEFMRPIRLEVILPNGYQLKVNCCVSDNATALLEKSLSCVQLPADMMPYFCLFLVRRETKDSLVLLRKLMDFETPFVSRLYIQPCQIQIRKSYWNPNYDTILMKNSIALNLLFMQTVSEIEREWIIAPAEILKKLKSLQEYGMHKEYVEVARQLPLYGCLQFLTSIVDYPDAETSALIAIGNKELSMRTVKQDKILETKFRVTRMRVWRVTALHNTLDTKDKTSNLQLSFEYLMSKQNLRWITINSSQAMLMSVCLQEMVNELLNYKDNEQLTKSTTISTSQTSSASSSTTSSSSFSRTTPTSSSSTSSTPTSYFASTNVDESTKSPTSEAPVRFLAQRIINKQNPRLTKSHSYGAVFFRNSLAQEDSVQNEAFEGIGDDDL